MTHKLPSERYCDFTFRVGSAAHSIEEMSSRLGLEPTKAFRVGELEGDRKSLRTENLWILESALPDSVDLPDHLEAMLVLLEPNADGLGSLLGEDAWGDFMASVASDSGQFSTALSAKQIARVARLQVDLLLNLYPPEV